MVGNRFNTRLENRFITLGNRDISIVGNRFITRLENRFITF